jgi:hypothetical protein
MALHQYRFDNTPMALEIGKTRIHLHQWKNKATIDISAIKSIGIAYWGDENIQSKTDLEDVIKELLKAEHGKCSILISLKNHDEPLWLDINNSNECIYLIKDLHHKLSKLWKGIAPYEELTKTLSIQNDWNFEQFTKKIFKSMAVLYATATLLVGLKYLINWLVY